MAGTSNVGVYVAAQIGGGQGDRKLDNSRAAAALCKDESVSINNYRSSHVEPVSEKAEYVRTRRHISPLPVLQYVVFCTCHLSLRVRVHHATDFG